MRNANVRAAASQDSTFAAAGFSPRVGKYSGKAMTVLVVDDEPLIRWSLCQSLEAGGFTAIEAESARQALQRVKERDDIAVVLLDLKLPDSKDLGLLRSLRQGDGAPRIILMTAHGTAEILEEAVRAGAFRAVTKPFDLDHIVEIVRDAVVA
jgi:DNA-binding NtrC family response regulator